MDKIDSKNSKIYFRLPKGGRPVMGAGLEGIELKNYLYKNKVSKKILLTFTEYEFDLLQQKHKEINKIVNIDRVSFIKKNLFGTDSANLIKQKNNAELIKNLNKIGVNINQMVKKINSYKFINPRIIYQIKNVEDEILILNDVLSKIVW